MTDDTSTHAVRLAAYVLTLNEERHIADAILSLHAVTEHVLIVDSASTDGTVGAAQLAGAAVRVRPFDSFQQQRNYAIASVVELFDPAWILTIDADERLSAPLIGELRSTILTSSRACDADACLIPRAVRFEGRLLRFGGVSRTRLLRLYRPTAGRYETRTVNEHFALAAGKRLRSLKSPIEHCDVTSWERHIAKHNRYSTLEAEERAAARRNLAQPLRIVDALRAPHLRRRWLRENIWNHLPGKPFLRFFQMYLLSGGFLDGGPGFDLAVFQAWQELCTEQKFRELVSRSDQHL